VTATSGQKSKVGRSIALSGFVTLLLAVSFHVEAQQTKKVYRVGFLSPFESPQYFQAFRQGMHELGYAEGQNLIINYRSANGMPERFLDLAAELVRLNVDVIVAASGGAVVAAKKVTGTIPLLWDKPEIPWRADSSLASRNQAEILPA